MFLAASVQNFRFGPRESKKAMVYSDVGRLNCNVSYTTFASPTAGQVRVFYRVILTPDLIIYCFFVSSN